MIIIDIAQEAQIKKMVRRVDVLVVALADQGSPSVTQHIVSVESLSLLLRSTKCDLFV